MFNKEDLRHIPNTFEMSDYINNPLWDKFCSYLIEKYNVQPKFEFSKCSFEYGWNIKFKKGSKSLCTVYPRENYFVVMIVIGKKEKVPFEELLPSLSSNIQELYFETKEGNNQKWLMIELEDENKIYDDIKKIIDIRYHA